MNLNLILLISIALLPLTLTLCVLIYKRGLYWINGQCIIPSPNQTINIIEYNELESSNLIGLVGRFTKVLSFFGSLRIDPNLEFTKILIDEFNSLNSKKYLQKRFTIDLVDLIYINSTAINSIITFLISTINLKNDCIEIKIVFPIEKFNTEFLNFQKLFDLNKNITITQAGHNNV